LLPKDTPPAEIIRAIRLVAIGEAPSVTRTLIERFGADLAADRKAAATASLRELTGRELEVAIEVARGHSNAEFAARRYMSEATVKAHVSRVLAKPDAANRVQIAIVVRYARLS
jgi:DNA-binding NarL/FixJ family response regulator